MRIGNVIGEREDLGIRERGKRWVIRNFSGVHRVTQICIHIQIRIN